jgi:5,10-methenyltetrahydrofolate synthetase
LKSASTPRRTLRATLLEQREQFMTSASSTGAAAAVARHLAAVLMDLEPELLGLYWPHRSEFNAPGIVLADAMLSKLSKALPFAQRSPVQMHYRAWDGAAPTAVDDCGIPASTGAPVLPDVVLVPCVGFSADGYRLGYGGGYFDRWLAAHPDVTAIGVAWSGSEIDAGALDAQPHDLPLTLIVTERGVA